MANKNLIKIVHNKNKITDYINMEQINNDTIDNNADKIDDKLDKNEGHRPYKQDKYIGERKNVLNKIFKIIGINKDNLVLSIEELDKNGVKQKQILDMEGEIKQYFTCYKWAYFTKKNIPKPYLSLLKSILKNENIKYNHYSIKDAKTQKNVGHEYVFDLSNYDFSENFISNEKGIGGRINKNIKYASEQKEISSKLLKILGINENNDIFYLDDLEKDIDKQQKILNLVEEVKEYFSCSGWSYFAKNIDQGYLSLTKSILKECNFGVVTVSLKESDTRRIIRRGYRINKII